MKFTIFKRLTFGYAAIMLMVVFIGIYLPLKLNQLNHLTRAVASVDGTTIRLIEHLLETLYSQVAFGNKYLVSNDKDFYNQFKKIGNYITEDIEKLKLIIDTPEKKKIFQDAVGSYRDYIKFFSLEMERLNKGNDRPEKTLIDDNDKLIDKINRILETIIKMARSDRDKKIEMSSRISRHILNVTSITAGLSVIMGILISFFNTKSITRAILLLQDNTKEIAKGKFQMIPAPYGPPEIIELSNHFNAMCARLKELDKMKTDFISYVSHELRTPLTAIKAAADMLKKGIFADTPGKDDELLSIVNNECKRLINSVNRILDLSRMEVDMMDYNFDKCSLLPVIQKTILNLAPIAQKNEISLELKPTPDLPHVRIDEERIAQVMENLIGNALKFTSLKDSIVIDISLANDEKGFIIVSVADTGCGIDDKDLELIFDKFKRIENGIETARGSGLGLSITKYIITAHGGKLWVQSEPDTGSTFFFTLPVA